MLRIASCVSLALVVIGDIYVYVSKSTNCNAMVRRNRLPSRALPEPTEEEKLQLLNSAIQAIIEDDVNKLLSYIPRGVDIRSVYQLRLGSPCKKGLNVKASLLHVAILSDSPACTKFLLHIGAPKEASESTLGDKALHLAVRLRRYDIISTLLEYGVKATSCNRRGDTALHIAARIGYIPVVKLLIQEGSDTKAKNRYGETPVSVAEIAGSTGSRVCADILVTVRTSPSYNSYL